MSTLWRVPFELLGLRPGDRPPARAALQIAPFEVVAALGGGFVFSADTFEIDEDDELAPVPGGLYDEDTFGPVPRTPSGGADLSAYRAERLTVRPQIRRSGEIVLPAPVLHPWTRRYDLPSVSAAAGVGEESVQGLLGGRLALDDGGKLRAVAERAQDRAAGYHLGAAAVARLARGAGSPLVGVLRRIPVLPAGLRPASRHGDELRYRDPTAIYQRVIHVCDALCERDDEEATLADRAARTADLQRYVEALFLDGLDARGRLAEPGQAVYQPLARGFTGSFGAQCLADLAAVGDPQALVLALRGALFVWRAWVEASGLEILPLGADGAVDEAARQKVWVDRAAGAFDQVYGEQLGPTLDDRVMHGPSGPPHVDGYAFGPRAPGDPVTVLTAGMSTAAMLAALPRDADVHVELVLLLPPDLDAPRREGMVRALLALARYPFVHGTFLAGGHDVGIGAPVVPGSALSAWVIFDLDEPWTVRLGDALPRHPRYLHAVAVTEADRAFKVAHGSAALRERLQATTAWISDPRRG